MQTDGQTWRTVAFRTFAGAPKKDKNFNKLNIWDMCFLIHNIPGTIMELIPAVSQSFHYQFFFLQISGYVSSLVDWSVMISYRIGQSDLHT